jgi:hypothetical protein
LKRQKFRGNSVNRKGCIYKSIYTLLDTAKGNANSKFAYQKYLAPIWGFFYLINNIDSAKVHKMTDEDYRRAKYNLVTLATLFTVLATGGLLAWYVTLVVKGLLILL